MVLETELGPGPKSGQEAGDLISKESLVKYKGEQKLLHRRKNPCTQNLGSWESKKEVKNSHKGINSPICA